MYAWILTVPLLCDADPPLTDLCRFPPPRVVAEQLELHNAHWGFVRRGYCLGGGDALWMQAWSDEMWACWWPWHHLDFAQENWHTPPERRESLRQLKALLGAEDYACGRMPPPLPWWRLNFRD